MSECVLNLSQDKVSVKSEFNLGFTKSQRRTTLKRKRIEKLEHDDDSSGPTVFEPDLHCSICVSMFKEPHVTRCGHTFCRQGSRCYRPLLYCWLNLSDKYRRLNSLTFEKRMYDPISCDFPKVPEMRHSCVKKRPLSQSRNKRHDPSEASEQETSR